MHYIQHLRSSMMGQLVYFALVLVVPVCAAAMDAKPSSLQPKSVAEWQEVTKPALIRFLYPTVPLAQSDQDAGSAALDRWLVEWRGLLDAPDQDFRSLAQNTNGFQPELDEEDLRAIQAFSQHPLVAKLEATLGLLAVLQDVPVAQQMQVSWGQVNQIINDLAAQMKSTSPEAVAQWQQLQKGDGSSAIVLSKLILYSGFGDLLRRPKMKRINRHLFWPTHEDISQQQRQQVYRLFVDTKDIHGMQDMKGALRDLSRPSNAWPAVWTSGRRQNIFIAKMWQEKNVKRYLPGILDESYFHVLSQMNKAKQMLFHVIIFVDDLKHGLPGSEQWRQAYPNYQWTMHADPKHTTAAIFEIIHAHSQDDMSAGLFQDYRQETPERLEPRKDFAVIWQKPNVAYSQAYAFDWSAKSMSMGAKRVVLAVRDPFVLNGKPQVGIVFGDTHFTFVPVQKNAEGQLSAINPELPEDDIYQWDGFHPTDRDGTVPDPSIIDGGSRRDCVLR